MLLGLLVVEQGTQFVYEVVLLVWELDGGHHDVIRGHFPGIVGLVVDAARPAGEIYLLTEELLSGLDDGAPLAGCAWPIQVILVDVLVEAVVVLAPGADDLVAGLAEGLCMLRI